MTAELHGAYALSQKEIVTYQTSSFVTEKGIVPYKISTLNHFCRFKMPFHYGVAVPESVMTSV